MGKLWVFEQLGGQKKRLTLQGAAAPHGRERRDPLVKDGIKLRRSRQYYSGNDVPTTHVFGVHHDDWQIKGRFQDSFLGEGGTRAAILQWLEFVADAQPVRVSWGNVISIEGLVDSFVPGRESEYHSTYEISILVDQRTDLKGKKPPPLPLDPVGLCQAIREFIAGDKGIADKVKDGTSLSSLADGITEALGDAVGTLGQFSAAAVNIAQGLDDLASGTIGQVERLQAIAQQMKTACIKMQNTLDNAFGDDSALAYVDADAEVQAANMRAGIEADLNEVMGLLADLDRETELAQRGRPDTVYVAVQGDTWESIASNAYGGPDRANDIRDANGVRFGELPISGQSYQIPV